MHFRIAIAASVLLSVVPAGSAAAQDTAAAKPRVWRLARVDRAPNKTETRKNGDRTTEWIPGELEQGFTLHYRETLAGKLRADYKGQLHVQDVPRELTEGQHHITIHATGERLGGDLLNGGIEGWVEVRGLQLANDPNKKKWNNFAHVDAHMKEPDQTTYGITVPRNAGRELMISLVVRGAGKITWVYSSDAAAAAPAPPPPERADRDSLQARICALLQELLALDDPRAGAGANEAARGRERARRTAELADLRNQLAALPGGPGFGPQNAALDEYRARREELLSRFPADDAEQRAGALARFHDWVYIERDGTIHGDLRAARNRALAADADGALGDADESLGARIENICDQLGKIPEPLQVVEGQAAAVVAHVESIRKANDELRALVRGTSGFRPGGNPRTLNLEQLTTLFERAQALLTTGELSAANVGRAIAQIDRLPPAEAQRFAETIAHLKSVRASFRGLEAGGFMRRLSAQSNYLKQFAREQKAALQETAAKMTELKNESLTGFDRFFMMLSAAQALGGFAKDVDAGVDPIEAGGRNFANFAIDMVFAGVPLLGAIDMATWMCTGVGTKLVRDKTELISASDLAKALTGRVLDGVGALSRGAQRLWDGDLDQEALRRTDPRAARNRLALVECRLAALVPGDEAEPQLLAARATLRALLRAQAEIGAVYAAADQSFGVEPQPYTEGETDPAWTGQQTTLGFALRLPGHWQQHPRTLQSHEAWFPAPAAGGAADPAFVAGPKNLSTDHRYIRVTRYALRDAAPAARRTALRTAADVRAQLQAKTGATLVAEPHAVEFADRAALFYEARGPGGTYAFGYDVVVGDHYYTIQAFGISSVRGRADRVELKRVMDGIRFAQP
ncbi:MAG: hypothetical protein AB7Q17_08685 [Phycisphaerae bacterium]